MDGGKGRPNMGDRAATKQRSYRDAGSDRRQHRSRTERKREPLRVNAAQAEEDCTEVYHLQQPDLRVMRGLENSTIVEKTEARPPSTTSGHRLKLAQKGLIGGSVNDEDFIAAIEQTREALPCQVEHSSLEVAEPIARPPEQDQPNIEAARTAADLNESSDQLDQIRRPLEALRPLYRTVYVLGSGPIGQYIAHSLASLPNPPPVTLLLHRPLLIQQWQEEDQTIKLFKDGKIFEEAGIHVESSAPFKMPRQETAGCDEDQDHPANPSDSVIDHLVVTTRGPSTIPALSNIKHRLRPHSTICFIADGLGTVEEVNSSIFTRPLLRPNYILGNISHHLDSSPEAQFTIIERSAGGLSLTMLPRPPAPPRINSLVDGPLVRTIDYGWSASTTTSTYLIRTMTRASNLNAVGLSLQDYLELQLERLSINATLGPISAIFDCSNNQLLSNYQASRTMNLLLEEISVILRSLPESRRMSDPDHRFSVRRLHSILLSVIVKTGKNTTTMLRDVREGRRTEVDYFNGYLARRAAELGIPCPHNEMLISMVKAKQAIRSREKNMYIPFIDL